MRSVFRRTPYLSKQGREELAEALNISEETISVSFKKRIEKVVPKCAISYQ